MPEPVLGAAFVAMLAAVTVTDLDRRVIPNRILIVAGLIAIGITAVAPSASDHHTFFHSALVPSTPKTLVDEAIQLHILHE